MVRTNLNMGSHSNQKKDLPVGPKKDLEFGIQKNEVVSSPILSLGHLHCLSGALEHCLSKHSTNQNAQYIQAYTRSGATLHRDWSKVWKALQSSQKYYSLAN